MENHICLAFNYCQYCHQYWCQTCRKCKCKKNECQACGKYMKYRTCNGCGIKICRNCAYRDLKSLETGTYMLCRKCFSKICPRCEYFECICDMCDVCGLVATNLQCVCGEQNVCSKCLIENNGKCGIDCCYTYIECPFKKDIELTHHRCGACYNVFADPRKSVKNQLLTALLCLRPSAPQPIRLLICSFMAIYIDVYER